MSDNIKLLRNYLLYILVGLSICIVGITNVFADTNLDTSSWINVTGRNWSLSGQEYHSGGLTSDNSWTKSYYNISSGIYTPPVDYDYINWAYFQHQGSFNPCNNGNYRVTFKLKFSDISYVNYVKNLKWEENACAFTIDSSTGTVSANCGITYKNVSNIYIVTDFNDINGTSSSDFYISRFINLTCDLNTGAIIDSNTQNTQNIINNNNQNTQNIIDNQNNNTQQQIDSQKVCTEYDSSNISTDGYTLGDGGTQYQNANYGISNYISLTKEDTLTLINTTTNSHRSCFYNTNKQVISCFREANYSNNSKITIPDNTAYFRFTVNKLQNKPTFSICRNGNQALNDNLNDDNTSGATNEASDFFSSFNTETFGLTSIITAPLNLIRSVLSSTCTELQLPLPYLDNKKLTLPCMSTIYSQFFGSFFTIYQTITYGIIAYWVCVRIFNQVKDFKNPEHDEIEVMDL